MFSPNYCGISVNTHVHVGIAIISFSQEGSLKMTPGIPHLEWYIIVRLKSEKIARDAWHIILTNTGTRHPLLLSPPTLHVCCQ